MGKIIRNGITYGGGGSFLVNITAANYAGETVTLTDGTHTYTGEISTEGMATITVTQPGAYTATADGDELGTVTVGTYSIEYGGRI